MDYEKVANDIQRSLNSMASLDIKATENNLAHLWGAMNLLAGVRDTLRTYAEAQLINEASNDPAGGPDGAEDCQTEASGNTDANDPRDGKDDQAGHTEAKTGRK